MQVAGDFMGTGGAAGEGQQNRKCEGFSARFASGTENQVDLASSSLACNSLTSHDAAFSAGTVILARQRNTSVLGTMVAIKPAFVLLPGLDKQRHLFQCSSRMAPQRIPSPAYGSIQQLPPLFVWFSSEPE